MYDNCTFWLDRVDIGEETFSNLSNILTNVKEEISHETGESKIRGILKNLSIMQNEAGISIKGSLSRFYYWDDDEGKRGNLFPLDRRETEKAIKLMTDELGGVPMDKAKVRSLEFGSFIPVKKDVSEYLKRCGDYPRLQRCLFQDETLYYKHKGRRQPKMLCLYDKRKDAINKGYTITEGFDDYNLLKYELRLKGSIGRQLKCGEVTGITLYEKSFYNKLKDSYYKEFKKIIKIPYIEFEFLKCIKSVGDAEEMLLSTLIQEKGINVIENFIKMLQKKGVFSDRANYSRLRKKLNKIMQRTSPLNFDPLLRELENGITNMCLYA